MRQGERLAIDVTTALTQRAGVGRYTRQLVNALCDLPEGPILQPFYVAAAAPFADTLDPRLTPRALVRPIRRWRLEVALRHLLRRPVEGPWQGAALYHAPDVIFPPLRQLPVVTTVHDLSYVVYPQFHTRFNGSYLRALTPTMMRQARLVVAVSQATRRDLVERLGLPERKVRVVYSGVSESFRQALDPNAVAEVRERLGVSEPFILSVGTLEPRKNLAAVVAAYRLLRVRLPDAPPLVLVGGAGWRLDQSSLIGAADAAHVRLLGFLSDTDLHALYASCTAFVYPSLYEGWGFPVAEALTLGAPTVTSNLSSLPEVAGDAALLVDPRRPAEIADALQQIVTGPSLATRLRLAGPLQTAPFTVQACAEATRQVYREALDG